jgi:SAM-dependent methyltransferase
LQDSDLFMEIDAYTEYVNFPCHYERLRWIYQSISEGRDKNKTVRILDVGCGTGNVTIPLGLIPNSQVVGIDVHQGNLDISEKRNKFPNVSFKFQYFQECDISSFDYIILTEVLEHIPNYQEIFSHAAKNGSQNFELQITIPNGFGPFEASMQPLYLMRRMGMNNFIWKVKKLFGKKEPYSQNYDTPHVNFFTIPRLRKELKAYGLEITEVKKAYCLSPIVETYLPFIPLKTFSKVDNAVTQVLPSFLSSGWYFKIKKIKS